MATEILRPQDCFIERIRVPPASYSRRRTYSNNHSNYHGSNNFNNHHAASAAASRSSNRKPVTRSDQRKRAVVSSSPQPVPAAAMPLRRTRSAEDSRLARSNGFAGDKVTILRRGQSLDSMPAAAVNGDMYAGSAFSVSPSPSALPLPSFSTKKQSSPAVDDSATRDLRRLLRLE
ncbi:hypothetical protein PIB30_014615 [Stylosanthes scabra]|uniref:Uncharacterized protein n=1 Tax=Stylosanthes scabra TaxID=79078 RepID=A0ABU6R720_9FABA|nr:hypothetical protein [Stylosanthes scabra]